ncbi:four-carbon acid sugar kinase family protein [Roseibium porphyridii]|uniref:3-oxo-tetronate kinase n=1 Tax=Roseibium porphyridii TaxID=2866279 RepID=A0ABY8EZS8_9HYPH|nr:3-oxo-tetronate kinase [Roseibium sp. KMA01]WFE88576.1 four-carbon acid sugar kinase family protein [Roseibium sp. KMA01]
MKLGVIADDFTGASDIALMLSEGGMPTAQFVGVPEHSIDDHIEAGVVGLKSRTIAAADAVAISLEACDWLLSQGCQQIIFKVCSTFDSTDAGNIGPVTEALADRLGEETVLVCPAFPENGRSVYQGHLFVKDVLLSESGMQHHPLTPMTDPDIRRVLARQTSRSVKHISVSDVWAGPDAVIQNASKAGKAMVVVDAVRNEDLMTFGRAAASRKLLTGGSGIALGLPQNFGFQPETSSWAGVSGKAVVLSGSCSAATRGQVAAYKASAPSRELNADDIMSQRLSLQEVVEWAIRQDTAPLLYSSADPAIVAAAQDKYGRENSADAIEKVFANLAAALSHEGVKRIVVAGGETSGAVVSGLQADTLEIGPKIAAGVPALKVAGRPLALALKSGNFGGPEFFSEALSVLEGRV